MALNKFDAYVSNTLISGIGKLTNLHKALIND